MTDTPHSGEMADPFLAHEVLDRALLCSEVWDSFVGQHRCTLSDANLAGLSDRISELLGQFYQAAGAIMAERYSGRAGPSPSHSRDCCSAPQSLAPIHIVAALFRQRSAG